MTCSDVFHSLGTLHNEAINAGILLVEEDTCCLHSNNNYSDLTTSKTYKMADMIMNKYI